jgi:hypothetical protein
MLFKERGVADGRNRIESHWKIRVGNRRRRLRTGFDRIKKRCDGEIDADGLMETLG